MTCLKQIHAFDCGAQVNELAFPNNLCSALKSWCNLGTTLADYVATETLVLQSGAAHLALIISPSTSPSSSCNNIKGQGLIGA